MSAGAKAQPGRMIMAGVPRVSLELQAQKGYSLEAQTQKFEELGEKYDCQFPPEYVIEDAGYSGADFGRPSIKRVLQLAAEGKIQGVAYTHLDRFARDVEGGLRLIREYRAAGLRVLLGNLGWVTDERHIRMQLQLGLMIAESMRYDIREKSEYGIHAKIRNREPMGGHPPFGFRFVTKAMMIARAIARGEPSPRRPGTAFERVEEHIQLVLRIFKLLAAGKSVRSVARTFSEEGIITIRGCKRCRKAGITATCTHWNPTFIRDVAINEFYVTGIWYYNKRFAVVPPNPRRREERHRTRTTQKLRPRDQWMECFQTEPLVSRALFERVQENVKGGKSRNGGKPSDRWLLSGLKDGAKCAVCGYSLKGSGQVRYYRCSNCNRVTNEALCEEHHRGVAADRLEATTLAVLREEVGDPIQLRANVDRYERDLVDQVDAGELDEVRKQATILRNRLDAATLKELNEDDLRSKQITQRFIAELKPQVRFLEARVATLERSQARKGFQVDARGIAAEIREGLETDVRGEQKQIIHHWISEIRYANGEAEFTVRIPIATSQSGVPSPNCKLDVDPAYSFIPLKIKRLVAA